MKSTELKKMIKEAVKEAIQEELKDILLEAVRSPKTVVSEMFRYLHLNYLQNLQLMPRQNIKILWMK